MALELLPGFCVIDLVDVLLLIVLPNSFVGVSVAQLFHTFAMLLTEAKATVVVAHIPHDELTFSMEFVFLEWAGIRESFHFIFIGALTVEFAILKLTPIDFLSTIKDEGAFVHAVIQECAFELMTARFQKLDALSVFLVVHPLSLVRGSFSLVDKSTMAISLPVFKFTLVDSAFLRVDQMALSVRLTTFNGAEIFVIRGVNNRKALLLTLLLIFGPLPNIGSSRRSFSHVDLMSVPVEAFATLLRIHKIFKFSVGHHRLVSPDDFPILDGELLLVLDLFTLNQLFHISSNNCATSPSFDDGKLFGVDLDRLQTIFVLDSLSTIVHSAA